MPTGTIAKPALARQLLDAIDQLNGGLHPGFRPAHAKGDVLGHIHTGARCGETDSCPAREQAFHLGDGALLGRNEVANHS